MIGKMELKHILPLRHLNIVWLSIITRGSRRMEREEQVKNDHDEEGEEEKKLRKK